MYKKRIRKGNKTYTYYYHNYRENGIVRNISLGRDKLKAKEKLSQLTNPNSPEKLPYKPSQPFLLLALLITFTLGMTLLYSFSTFTGLTIYNDDTISLDVNDFVSKEAQVFLVVENQEFTSPITQFSLSPSTSNNISGYNITNLDINISSYPVDLTSGFYTFFASVVDNSTLIAITSKEVQIFSDTNKSTESNMTDLIESVNETIPDTNPITPETIVSSNETRVETVKTVEQVRIGRPVTWIKTVKLENPTNISIEIPKQASNLTVEKITNNIKQKVDKKKIKLEDQGVITPIIDTNLLTGLAILEVEEENNTLLIEEEVEELEITYETPAPIATETQLTNSKKRIIVSSEVHYENILTFTEIPDTELGAIHLYWIQDNSRQEVEFTGFDYNGDNLIDFVEWITPSLSNQTYEIELEILTIQSYPVVGGNWEVKFTTSGIANLTIKAVNGTTWDNENENNDLKFLEISCGSSSKNYQWIDNSVFIQDYNCDNESTTIVKVLTPGIHEQQYTFGGITKSAFNTATLETTNSTWFSGIFNGTKTNIDNTNLTLSLELLNQTQITNQQGDNNSIKDNATGLILLMHMNQETSNSTGTSDDSGLGNNGVFVDGARCGNVSGRFNEGCEFDGDDDYIDAGTDSSLDFTDTFAVSVWINPDTKGDFEIVIGRWATSPGHDWVLNFENQADQLLKFGIRQSDGNIDVATLSPIPTNEWTHIVGVYDGTDILIYMNGVVQETTPASGNIDNDGAILSIGSAGDSTLPFNGAIDEVAIYNRSLSASEVYEMYNRLKGRFISQTIDTQTANSTFNNISWSEPYQYGEELPNNGTDEKLTTTIKGGANMTGNVLLMHFNNDTRDYSGFGNDGTGIGGTICNSTLTNGVFQGACEFDGEDDAVNMTGYQEQLHNFTACAWFKSDGITDDSYDRIIDKSFNTAFKRSSNSPRYLVPATRAPISRVTRRFS